MVRFLGRARSSSWRIPVRTWAIPWLEAGAKVPDGVFEGCIFPWLVMGLHKDTIHCDSCFEENMNKSALERV